MSYVRSRENGFLFGQNIDAMYIHIFAHYYAPTTHSIIGTSAADLARFRAGLFNQQEYFEWYSSVTATDVKKPLGELILTIELYMKPNPT